LTPAMIHEAAQRVLPGPSLQVDLTSCPKPLVNVYLRDRISLTH
jgi:hypothetical protein